MSSLPQGILRVLAWFDSTADELKALINDDGRMPVSLDEQNVDLATKLQVYDSSSWIKSPILWGYTDTVVETVYEPNALLGLNTLVFTAVDEGYIHKIAGVSVRNANSGCTIVPYVRLSNQDIPVGTQTAVTASNTFVFPIIDVTLKEADKMKVLFYGCTALDDLYAHIWGYKMKVNM